MQALVKTANGKGSLEIRDVPKPKISPNEVLVRVRACGICGSDLKIEDDQHPYTPPVIIGHEFSGEIVEVGTLVQGWTAGDRVVSEQHVNACGACRHCLSGNTFVCSSKRAPGYFSDGAFAEYIKLPAWLLHRIPNTLNFVEAALSEPAAVAVHGMLERTGIAPEDVVMILGCGPIGLLAAKMAQSVGASSVIITGIERDEKLRLPKARLMDIDHVVNTSQEDLQDVVDMVTHGDGADVVIELSGALPAIKQAFQFASRLGKVGIIGQPPSDEVTIPYRDAMFRALKISFSYSSKHSSWERALSMFGRGIIQPREFITNTLPLSKWKYGFNLLRAGEAIKVVLEP